MKVIPAMTTRGECGFGGSLNCSVCHCLLRSLFSMFISTSVFSMFASSSVFFNVYAFLCFLNVISTSAFFDVLHQHMLFNVYANFVFFSMFIYPPLFFSMFASTYMFLMFTPISFFLMIDQQLSASVSQKSKFSRQYLVCLSLGTNIRLCHRSALSAQTISQSSLNIVSREFFLSYLGG